MISKSSISFVFMLLCDTHASYDQRRFFHVSLNVIIVVSEIEIKHHIKCKNVRTNNAVQ